MPDLGWLARRKDDDFLDPILSPAAFRTIISRARLCWIADGAGDQHGIGKVISVEKVRMPLAVGSAEMVEHEIAIIELSDQAAALALACASRGPERLMEPSDGGATGGK